MLSSVMVITSCKFRLTNFHKICIFPSVINEGGVSIKFKMKRINLIVFVVALIAIFYVSFTFRFTYGQVNRTFDNLYQAITH